MGEVYRARDLALGRTAAIKLIASDGDVAMRERLVREAESSARLQHPAIATFFEGGVDGRVAWLALEFVAGETLRTRLARGAFAASETIWNIPSARALADAAFERQPSRWETRSDRVGLAAMIERHAHEAHALLALAALLALSTVGCAGAARRPAAERGTVTIGVTVRGSVRAVSRVSPSCRARNAARARGWQITARRGS